MSKENLKRFGRTMGLCLLVIGLLALLRHKPVFRILWLMGAGFLFLAQVRAALLKPVYKFWMALAFCLGWINTRIILILLYYLVVTPIGLITRLLRKDLLNLKLEKSALSYWHKRELAGAGYRKDSYERIF